jgi:hypothetical protein
MLQMNGKGSLPMTAPAPKPPEPEYHQQHEVINLFGLRLWVICCMVIVGFGIINYVLNWLLGVGH